MPETLYLIDGHALAYRTYFALTGGGNASRWTTSKGEPTAGVFGFTSVLLRLLEQEQPDYLAVAFDTGKTFRDELFSDYKATREKMPDDLRTQIQRMRQLVDAFNIPRLEMEGFEADDVLGSVANAVAAKGYGVKIITGDRDLLQLVTERIIVNLPGRKLSEAQDYNAEGVKEKMGVRPDQVVDLKALMGDSSDNIPGVKGVGQKTAEKLLAAYDTLDGVYENLDAQTAGLQKKLKKDKDNAYLSQKLAQIVTDLDMPLDLEQARITNFKPEEVQGLFQELEFRNLMGRLNRVMGILGMIEAPTPLAGEQLSMFGGAVGATAPSGAGVDIETVLVDDQKKLDNLVSVLNAAEMIAFDTETTGTDKMQAELVGISLAVAPGTGYYIPLGHTEGQQLPMDTVLDALQAPMRNLDIPKSGHNLKYDYVMLRRYGLDVQPLSFDTMIAEWLRDPASRNLGLKKLCWVRLGEEMTEISVLIGKGKKQITMAEVAIENAAPYAAADAEVVIRLIPQLQEDMEKVGAIELFKTMEMPLIRIMSEMEMEGIALDTEFLAQMSGELQTVIDEMREKVFTRVGHEFNLNSTQQLSDALFKEMGITPPHGTKKNASGHYSTAAGVLEGLRDRYPIVDWILSYRELTKLNSTYVDALPTQVNPVTKRVHTSYQQTGSVTGRLASSDPNLQNIPIRTELGRRVREAFVAPPGHQLLAVDYSQVELRIAAHMSDDQAMIQAFLNDQDIHATTAAAIYNVSLEAVSKEQRRHAKAINFGLIYGMSSFGLTRTTDLTLAEAEDFVKAYFEQFPGVKAFLDDLRQHALEHEFVETLQGRRRYFHGLSTQTNQMLRNRMLREAINAPIQGTAADIMKLSMLKVPPALKAAGLKSRVLLQVHDELILECPEAEVKQVAALVMDIMAKAFQIKVPLKTEARAGLNWGKMEVVSG